MQHLYIVLSEADKKDVHSNEKNTSTQQNNDNDNRDVRTSSSLISKHSKNSKATMMTSPAGGLFERSRATKHMECIGEDLDIEVQAANADKDVQRRVEESQRSEYFHFFPLHAYHT